MTKVKQYSNPLEYIRNHIGNKQTISLFNNYSEMIREYQVKSKNKYKVGDSVILNKNSLIHGISNFDFKKIEGIDTYGFIFSEFFDFNVVQQKLCVCFWVVKEEIKLSDYIKNYSGETIHYYNRLTKNNKQIYIPHGTDVSDRIKLFNMCNKVINKIEFVRDSKETQFLPSLKKNDDYLGFILNSDLTNKVLSFDIYNGSIDKEILKSFLPDWVIKNTIEKRNNTRTDHEIALIYGLPKELIEGCIVGRTLENDIEKLKYIRRIFPDIYISNLNGKVI